MTEIKSILIANRGEIVSRIIRTCRKMGIKSIAVYSEADRSAPFVAEADQAIFIGESAPAASYLNQEKILAVAKKVKADAIHPGYGFLSENPEFAKKCKQEQLIFIGPNAAAIEAMGSKSSAKKWMQKNGIPVVPGYQGTDQSLPRLREEAIKTGFPVLLKATAGGGGKGMRIVRAENELEAAIGAVKREAANAFGQDDLIIEKYIDDGRHIEFQICGDQQGNVIHLLERECTIQRRYQKIIEESPSPVMDEALRQKMGSVAVQAGKSIHYDNAGTVEFIFDEQTGEFYFLEINTRLQVEHPVTEEITGLDLVKMQIESAQGMPLSITQAEVQGNGYALEVRLYAEDTTNNFLPVTGTVDQFNFPQVDGLRVELGIKDGSQVTIYYDPMIAKIIVRDESRSAAHRKMQYVLRNLVCLGLTTNQYFLLRILQNDDFLSGKYNTHFVEGLNLENSQEPGPEAVVFSAIAVTLFNWEKREKNRSLLRSLPSGWRNNFFTCQQEKFLVGEQEITITYRFKNGIFYFYENEQEYSVTLINAGDRAIQVEINGWQSRFIISRNKHIFYVHNELLGVVSLHLKPRFPEKISQKIKGGYESPMPSAVVKILVTEGQEVEAGQGLLVLSSMKMENTIHAAEKGVVEEIYAREGASVEAGFLLLKIMPVEEN